MWNRACVWTGGDHASSLLGFLLLVRLNNDALQELSHPSPSWPSPLPEGHTSSLSTNAARLNRPHRPQSTCVHAFVGVGDGSTNPHAFIDFAPLEPSIGCVWHRYCFLTGPTAGAHPTTGYRAGRNDVMNNRVNQMKLNLPVLLMIGALAIPAAAQTPASTSGVVVSSTTESLVVRMDDGTERTFNVTSTTALPTARLAEGNRVTVQYRPLNAGLFEAARVELAAAINRDRPVMNPTPDRSMMSEPAAIQDRVTGADTTATQRDNDANQRDANEDRETLPSTASPMPLLALAGVAALISSLVLKARRTA